MAKTSMIVKHKRKKKFAVRQNTRCKICGRPRAYIRMFGICRLCFRLLASSGKLPGVRKSSF